MGLEDLRETVKRKFSIATHVAKHEVDKILYQNTGRSIFYGSYSPPKVLEAMQEFEGISRDYNLPDNIDPWDLERSLSLGAMDIEAFRDLAREIIELNPELESLAKFLDHERYPIDICYGVTSGFNVDDIHFFLTSAKDIEGMKNRFVNVMAYQEGLNLEVIPWIASPKTLDQIAILCGKETGWKPSEQNYVEGLKRWDASSKGSYLQIEEPEVT